MLSISAFRPSLVFSVHNFHQIGVQLLLWVVEDISEVFQCLIAYRLQKVVVRR